MGMEYDRYDSKRPCTSAIADSLAYAASLVRLYADNFEAWRPSMGWKKPSPGPNAAKDSALKE
jgi:hypothetical protein